MVDDFNAGDSPTTYTIPGLVEGVPYYVRTKISNALGEGSYSVSSFNTPKSVPDAPRFAVGDHAAHVDEVQLIQTAASHIDEVQILTVTADHVSEVQSIRTSAPQGSTISGTFFLKYTTANGKLVTTAMEKQVVVVRSDGAPLLSGGYKLNFGNENTTCLKFDATAAQMEVALEGLGGINEVEVVRTGDATQGYSYTIAFMDSPSAQCSSNDC